MGTTSEKRASQTSPWSTDWQRWVNVYSSDFGSMSQNAILEACAFPENLMWISYSIPNKSVSIFPIEAYHFLNLLSIINVPLGRLHSILCILRLFISWPTIHTPQSICIRDECSLWSTEHWERYSTNYRFWLEICDLGPVIEFACAVAFSQKEIRDLRVIYKHDPISSYFFFGHAIAILEQELVRGGREKGRGY